jgi:hypothetical protein
MHTGEQKWTQINVLFLVENFSLLTSLIVALLFWSRLHWFDDVDLFCAVKVKSTTLFCEYGWNIACITIHLILLFGLDIAVRSMIWSLSSSLFIETLSKWWHAVIRLLCHSCLVAYIYFLMTVTSAAVPNYYKIKIIETN